MRKDKKIFEAEILDDKEIEKKIKQEFNFIDDQIKSFRNTLFLKGISFLIMPILIFILILAGLISLIYILFDHPWDHIITALIFFFLLKTFYKISKLFR